VKPSPVLTRATYIFGLEGPLDILRNIQEAAGLSEPPVAIQRVGEDEDASFCRVNGNAKQAIIRWLTAQQTKFSPTFVRVS
jgi:hypothetical protein